MSKDPKSFHHAGVPKTKARWSIPKKYSIDGNDERVRLRDRPGLVIWPLTNLLAIHAIEERLNATDEQPIDRAIYLLDVGRPWQAEAYARRLWETARPERAEDGVLIAEVIGVCGTAADDIYRELWKTRDRKENAVCVLRIGMGLVELVHPTERGSILDELADIASGAPAFEAASFHLLLASLHHERPEGERMFEQAHKRWRALGDSLGLAECALLDFRRREKHERKLPREAVDYAIWRYRMDQRPAWAAKTVSHLLAAVVAHEHGKAHPNVAKCFEQAMGLIDGRPEFYQPGDMILRAAGRMGLVATCSSRGFSFDFGPGREKTNGKS